MSKKPLARIMPAINMGVIAVLLTVTGCSSGAGTTTLPTSPSGQVTTSGPTIPATTPIPPTTPAVTTTAPTTPVVTAPPPTTTPPVTTPPITTPPTTPPTVPPPPTPPASPPPTTPPAPPPTTFIPSPYAVSTATKANIGNYLVDGRGMTLYYTTSDRPNYSNLPDETITAWPVFLASSTTVAPALNAADFGTFTRDGNIKQTTYKGYPLYYCFMDKNPGDTLGNRLGGVWFVVNTDSFPP